MKVSSVLIMAVLAVAPLASPQQNPLLNAQAANDLMKRTVELMDSTTVAVPGLVRAAAPVLENARQAHTMVASASAQHSGLTYAFLSNARAYLALADAVPKPYPFPDQARQQFSELRDSVDRLESHFRALLEQKEAQLRSADRDNLGRYAEANQRLGAPDPKRPRVVFLGDSITDGWRLNEYFAGRDFVNRGISGQITGQMLGRMKADVLNLKPAALLILAGTNDIARGVAVQAIQNNLTMMADLADSQKVKVLFASILPVSDYHKDKNPRFQMTGTRPPAVINNLNLWIRELCRQRGYTYVDYHSKMVDKAGFLQAELADDGLHPNSTGYRVMAPVALESIDRAVGTPKEQPQERRKRLGVF